MLRPRTREALNLGGPPPVANDGNHLAEAAVRGMQPLKA